MVKRRSGARSWLEFWGADTPIYANARHKELHYATLARGIAEHVTIGASVLDYGCGEALSAAPLARSCGLLLLFDASPHVRRKLFARFSGVDRIAVLEDATLPEVAEGSLDLIVAASLIQYLSGVELSNLLDLWRSKLKEGGALLIADIPPPRSSEISDALSLLAFGWSGGFLAAALFSLARLYFSEYRRIRRECGFARYGETEIAALLAAHGFDASLLPRNLGPNRRRFAILARRAVTPARPDRNFGDCARRSLGVAVPFCKEMR